jgi:hypothetical protein
MLKYRVIGPCEVAGVEPGGTVTESALTKAGAVIGPLLGVHLEEIKDETRPVTAKKPAPRDDS